MIDTAFQREIIQSLSAKLRAYYVFPDVAEQIGKHLWKSLDDGEFADITEGDLFALALTIQMQAVNHDEHLWVKWHPESLPEEGEALRHNREWQDERKLEAGLDNYGLHRLERLPGNVGYIDIRKFHRPAWGGETAVAAMNFLANMDAMIIDLRKCTGGYPGMVAFILSYLLKEEPIHLSSIYWRDDDFTQQYWTLPFVPGKRFGDKPVFVLTSMVTFSAGEEFAAILQSRKRATVIGEKTDGGAHPGTSYRLSPHFEVFIPIGRLINPITGTDYEGIGVTPDIRIPQEQAYTAAYFMALRSILEKLDKPSSAPLRALVKEAQTAIADLGSNRNLCSQCGYPNQLDEVRCSNCDGSIESNGGTLWQQ